MWEGTGQEKAVFRARSRRASCHSLKRAAIQKQAAEDGVSERGFFSLFLRAK